jgi:hypothetical protein
MKKVLILAYDFPPYVSVGGLRPYSWYSYFKDFGIYPVVVTRQWSNTHRNNLDYIAASDFDDTQIDESEFGTIVRAAFKPNLSNRLLLKYGDSKFRIIRKFITAFYELGQFPFLIGPKSSIYHAADDYLKVNKVDVIIASGGPFIMFKYASRLSQKYKVNWLADYRDPWSQDKNRKESTIIQKWDAFFERKYIKRAHSIITVSSFLQKLISKLFSEKPFHIITNGYDPMAVGAANGIEQGNSKMSIAFVGTIYKYHPLNSFLKVCNDFIAKNINADFRLSFYGLNSENEIWSIVKSAYPDLVPYICVVPKLPNEKLLQKLAADNAFLLFNHYSYMGTKIYDYLALKRLIILCYTDDAEANEIKRKYFRIEELDSESNSLQADLIKETNSGIIVKDSEHLSRVLQELYTEFKAKGHLACNSINIDQYSRKIQAQKLAEILINAASKS